MNLLAFNLTVTALRYPDKLITSPSNLRLRPLLLAGTAILLVLLVLFGQLSSHARWALVLSDSAHGPVSAVIAIIMMLLMRERGCPATLSRQWQVSIAMTTALGIIIELVQSQIGRDAEVTDVLTDLLGAVAGTGFYVVATSHRAANQARRSMRLIGVVTATLAAVMLAIPVATMTGAYLTRQLRQPVLVDANASFGTYFLTAYWLVARTAPLPERWQTPYQSAGFLVPPETLTAPDQRWGLALHEPNPHWRRFSELAIDIVNPAPRPLKLRLRIFDRDDGLANALGYITTLEIPASTRKVATVTTQAMATGLGSQPINLDRVRGFVIDSPVDEPPTQQHHFYLVRIELQ